MGEEQDDVIDAVSANHELRGALSLIRLKKRSRLRVQECWPARHRQRIEALVADVVEPFFHRCSEEASGAMDDELSRVAGLATILEDHASPAEGQAHPAHGGSAAGTEAHALTGQQITRLPGRTGCLRRGSRETGETGETGETRETWNGLTRLREARREREGERPCRRLLARRGKPGHGGEANAGGRRRSARAEGGAGAEDSVLHLASRAAAPVRRERA